MNFTTIKTAVQRQFLKMVQEGPLLRVGVEGDELWEVYLAAFPAGRDPIFRKRTDHDCSCCRHFIKSVGGLVCVEGGELVSLWDVSVGEGYQPVVNAMSKLVKSRDVAGIFLSDAVVVGTDKSYEKKDAGSVVWEHFHLRLPEGVVAPRKDVGTKIGEARATYDVMLRSLQEINLDSVDAVLELIDQNSLYRGEEHAQALVKFRAIKVVFDGLTSARERSLFCWSHAPTTPPAVSRVRNTVVGTLLVDLSEDKDVDDAVRAFETKVAPANYKRPTALVTKAMIENARAEVERLGLTSALERRFATLDDVTVRDVIFADRETRRRLSSNVFDEIAPRAESTKKLDRVEEIGIDDFVACVLPRATSLEVMVENTHLDHLVSLIAPCDLTAERLFKWGNNFSWSYAGDFADSIKERVKKAGGKVDGDLRCSLSWFNYDDLDLHMREPGGFEIYFSQKQSPLGGALDVDMNAWSGQTRSAVENICYAAREQMRPGTYTLSVHNFSKRESVDVGFEVEIEFDGNVHTFAHPNAVGQSQAVTVAEIHYSREEGFKIGESLPSSQVAKEAWGIKTQSFIPVEAVMLSPNFWDEDGGAGNKHFFFMLRGCVNAGTTRGFYNEFLLPELNPHRKVLEIVGSKMRTRESDAQLSGIGFSSTRRDHLLCRVKGSFTRTVKVLF
jgi:hypothetical protein